jgi:hypothetical protein
MAERHFFGNESEKLCTVHHSGEHAQSGPAVRIRKLATFTTKPAARPRPSDRCRDRREL